MPFSSVPTGAEELSLGSFWAVVVDGVSASFSGAAGTGFFL